MQETKSQGSMRFKAPRFQPRPAQTSIEQLFKTQDAKRQNQTDPTSTIHYHLLFRRSRQTDHKLRLLRTLDNRIRGPYFRRQRSSHFSHHTSSAQAVPSPHFLIFVQIVKMPLFGGYNASKLKPQLKMAVTRFQIAANKKSALSKQQIREIATLLAEQPNPKEEKARIKAESLIRDDNTIEAYEILQLTCDLLAERINLITHSKECPPDLVGSVSTLIWASSVVDIPELIEVRKQFRYKYGKQFEEDAMTNVGGVINERVAAKLSVQPPSAYLVQTYLEKIADEHQVDWKPKVPLTAEAAAEPMVAPIGYSVPVGGGSGLNTSAYVSPFLGNDLSIGINNRPTAPPVSPSFTIPPVAPSGSSTLKQQQQQNQNQNQNQQQSKNIPVVPSSTTVPPRTIDDIEEVDIFVPGVPRVPPGGGSQLNIRNGGSIKHGNKHEEEDSDNDGDGAENGGGGGQRNGSGGGGFVEESYDDLAARFAMLQK